MRRSAATTISTIRMDFALSSLRRIMHITNIAVTPIASDMNCLNRLSGAEEATTARLRVDRKKAMVSISKAVFPRLFITAKYVHISSIKPPKAAYTCTICSVPSAIPS